MNQANTIKSMIPPGILRYIPSERREEEAGNIVACFREADPGLYEQIGRWDVVPDEMIPVIVEKVRRAAAVSKERHLKGL